VTKPNEPAPEPTYSIVDLTTRAREGDRDSAQALIIRAFNALGGNEELEPALRDYLAEAFGDIAGGEDPAVALNLRRIPGRPGGENKDRDLCYAAAVQIVNELKKADQLGVHQRSDPIGLVTDFLSESNHRNCSYSTVEKAIGAHNADMRLLSLAELYPLAEQVLPDIRTAFTTKTQ